ncbi:MAG TPA: type I-E CRISPR-associated protein Cas5/CasD [Mycobacteriales bacterium]|nr:type I-E CRISPR-associated protein Cas5/CasD [Mycobacteriales bacterium]
MTETAHSLVLRLAGPMQSWGSHSQFNRRETGGEPTKSGITGLLAAALGRRREDPIEDLLRLNLGVRTDQPGSLLRDYHTVSDYRDRPLLSAKVSAKGLQTPTSPAKYTHVTERFYLQDAVFVAAVSGPVDVLTALADAVRHPAFPLALGRRACVPTQPLLLRSEGDAETPYLWRGEPFAVLKQVPWQVSKAQARALGRQAMPSEVDLPVTVDDLAGNDSRIDVPTSFEPRSRGFTARPVRQDWVRVPTPFEGGQAPESHDPFALLGW